MPQNLALALLFSCLLLLNFAQRSRAQTPPAKIQPEMVVQTGHTSMVMLAAYSPTGKLAATFGADGVIRVWDMALTRHFFTFADRGVAGLRSTECLAFSRDGRILFASGRQHVIINGMETDTPVILAWDTQTGKPLPDFNWEGEFGQGMLKELREGGLAGTLTVSTIAVSPDGTKLAAGINGLNVSDPYPAIFIWDLASHQITTRLTIPKGGVSALAWDDTGHYLAAALSNTTVQVWTMPQAQEITTFSGHADHPLCLAFRPHSHQIASAGADKVIRLWDAVTGAPIRTLTGHTKTVDALCFTPDGNTLISAAAGDSIHTWNVETGTEAPPLKSTHGQVTDNQVSLVVALSPDGNLLITDDINFGNGLKLWDFPQRRFIRDFASGGHAVDFAAFMNADKTIISGTFQKAWVWNSETGALTGTLDIELNDAFNPSAYSQQMTRIAHITPQGIVVAGVDDGKTLCTIPIDLADKPILHLTPPVFLSGDGLTVGTQGATGLVQTWHVATSKKADSVPLKMDTTQLFSSSQENAMGLNYDGTVLASFRTTPHLPSLTAMLSTPSAPQTDTTGSTDQYRTVTEIVLRDMASGQEIGRIPWSYLVPTSLAFSPDGNLFAISDTHNDIQVWKIRPLKQVCRLHGHTSGVTSLNFSSDSHRLVSGSDDGTVRLWDPVAGHLIVILAGINDQDYAVSTSESFYTASKGAYSGIVFRLGNHAYPFEQFDLRLNRPDKVLTALGCPDKSLIASYQAAYAKRLARMGFTEAMLGDNFHLPECVITAKDLPAAITSRALTFGIQAADTQAMLDRLQVFVNDVPVNFTLNGQAGIGSQGLKLRGKNLRTIAGQVTLPLSAGANKIQVSALNSQGTESLRQTFDVTCTAPAAKPDLYVVAVGVSKYLETSHLPTLNSADKDAQALLDFFTGQTEAYAHPPHVLPLLNADATQANILAAKQFLSQSQVDDEVVVFFAGHGILDDSKDYYFGTHDVDALHPAVHGLSFPQIEGLLDGIPARKKLLLMDTCYAGEVDKPTVSKVTSGGDAAGRGAEIVVSKRGLADVFDLQVELFADLRRGSGATVIAAGRGIDTAGEDLKHGYFTQSVLDALQGNPHLTVSALRDLVTTQIAQQTQGAQHPTARRENLDNDFPVVPLQAGS